jgi:hypothetical protein
MAHLAQTQAVDLVVDPTGSQLKALLSLLPDTEYYVSDEAALEALARRSRFNVIDSLRGSCAFRGQNSMLGTSRDG